jgi:hypothetical protein
MTGGTRALILLLAGALVLASVVMVITVLELADTPTCADVEAQKALPNDDGDCYTDSATAKTIQTAFGWPSAVLAALAALVALLFAFTGRRGALVLPLTGAALVTGAVSILIGAL